MKEKPLILELKETENRIVEIINNSNIPAFILKNTIKEIYNQLINIEQQEYQYALESENKENKESDK